MARPPRLASSISSSSSRPPRPRRSTSISAPGYRVLASYGHVRDLDTHKKKGDDVAGIDITNGWKLRYVVDDGSEDDGRADAASARRQPRHPRRDPPRGGAGQPRLARQRP